jgi:phosphonate transport system substrate-binding protein
VRRGQVNENDFRIVYRSKKFPTSSFAHAHDLDPKLADKITSCFYDFRFTDDMKKAFDPSDRFVPINYKTTWEPVRAVAAAGGESFGKAAYQKEAEREAAAKKK